jgi:hypothetical protein
MIIIDAVMTTSLSEGLFLDYGSFILRLSVQITHRQERKDRQDKYRVHPNQIGFWISQ